MRSGSDEEPDNEWMRAYLDGEDPPSVNLPYFFLTGLPFDSPVWLEPEVFDAIGVPTNSSYVTLGVSGVEHVLERRDSREQTHRLTQMACSILARPEFVQRYDDVTQKFAVVGRTSEYAPWVLVAAELRPSYTGRDEIRVTSIHPIKQRTLENRVANQSSCRTPLPPRQNPSSIFTLFVLRFPRGVSAGTRVQSNIACSSRPMH